MDVMNDTHTHVHLTKATTAATRYVHQRTVSQSIDVDLSFMHSYIHS